jgi:hypothetical protein
MKLDRNFLLSSNQMRGIPKGGRSTFSIPLHAKIAHEACCNVILEGGWVDATAYSCSFKGVGAWVMVYEWQQP